MYSFSTLPRKAFSLGEAPTHSTRLQFSYAPGAIVGVLMEGEFTRHINSDYYKKLSDSDKKISFDNKLKTMRKLAKEYAQLKSFYKNKQLWNKETKTIVPIGINAFHKKKYIFNHNPYFCKEEDDIISNDMKKFVNTENRKLLFKYKPKQLFFTSNCHRNRSNN